MMPNPSPAAKNSPAGFDSDCGLESIDSNSGGQGVIQDLS